MSNHHHQSAAAAPGPDWISLAKWAEHPVYSREHIMQRVRERLKWPGAVIPMQEWVKQPHMVPPGKWFKQFYCLDAHGLPYSYFLVGEGRFMSTVRTQEMGAKGIRIARAKLLTALFMNLDSGEMEPLPGQAPSAPVLASMDEAKPKIKYGTVQAELPEDSDAYRAVADVRAEIASADLAGKGTDVGPSHITVRYGIQTDDTAEIEAYLSRQAPMVAKLGATSSFPPSESSDNAAVIIAPVECPELHGLNERLADVGDFKVEDFDYKPHVTIAYVKPEAAETYIGLDATAGQSFEIREVAVVNKSKEKKIIVLNGTAKTAAAQPDVHAILHELFPILMPGLPDPEIKIVNQKNNWLGQDLMPYGKKNGQTWCGENTTIELQKRAIGDEGTLRRVLAHELCHHEDNLLNDRPKILEKGYDSYKFMQRFDFTKGHGPKWKEIAARFNARYGADFVTPKSDESYVVSQPTELAPFFVLMYPYYDGKLMWAHASRLSPKMKNRLADRHKETNEDRGGYKYRLFMTTDPFFQRSPLMGDGSAVARDEEQRAKAQKLWDEGEDVLAQYAAPTPKKTATAKEIGPVYHGAPKWYDSIKNDKYTVGRFFSSSLEVAKAYGPQVFTAYLTMNKPLIVDAQGNFYESIPTPEVMQKWTHREEIETDLVAEFAFKHGYDGVIVKNVLEPNKPIDGTHDYIVFHTDQVRLVDPETGRTAAAMPPPTAPHQPYTAPDSVANNENFKGWFYGSKVVDAQGRPLRVYRGDFRGDLLGDKFKKNRSTSGRFYFTDDPEIASKYSVKVDNQRMEENSSTADWFRFPEYRYPREKFVPNMIQVWYRLKPDERQRIKHVLENTKMDDQNEFEFDSGEGLHSGIEDLARRYDGNWLRVAHEVWLDSGALFDEEHRFSELLDKAGISHNFDDPRDARSLVTPVYLSIKNPIDTSAIPANVIEAFRRMAKADRSRAKSVGYDQWDKSTFTVRTWFEKLENDIKEGETYAWTVIPEKITQALQEMGYDGVKDTGGKNGGNGHNVWIAFEPNQIKSALGNKGTYDSSKDSIVASRKAKLLRKPA